MPSKNRWNQVRPTQYRVIDEFEQSNMAVGEALSRLSGKYRTDEANSTMHMTRERLLQIISRMDSLVGLDGVKEMVRQIFAHVYIQEQRRLARLKTDPLVLHMVFSGNPGTGKTTVARLIAEMFRDCGLLEKGHLVEVERADLVGEYIGHTAQKTRESIQRALGGVLFIDEAYSLARGGNKDFGREAIDCLVKGIEDYRNQFVAIIAGYENEMKYFLSTNPGLPSRFPIHLHFPDYTLSSLIAIARQTAQEHQYKLAPDAEFILRRKIQQALLDASREFSNARFVRNLIEKAIRHQASRLFQRSRVSREELMTLRAEDFREEDVF
ncbi:MULTISPECIES: AAA family ATPase [Alicyclobacillus]|uniref:Stage V sporulation protein K n=2 Tax=Alicyclobacillus tolerans TaxID=90970 RepID=A0ABT9LXE4_9BACL|nr:MULTISPECIES: AAA family ATPase [Alicyclobacillus]MDP9728935.1 stage V sporulation protein K [Alicyclobacillus tengchongensis]SHL02028.1 stage V sporulation protein K [Alicyclobacillus montanus]